MQDDEVVREFLVESHENLSRLDRELVELENHPKDARLLGSIFRTIHTIKGTCGFFAFSTLERITHQAENLLSQLRDGERELTPELVSLILETMDATRQVLESIEKTGKEGDRKFEELAEKLCQAAQSKAVKAPPAKAPTPIAAPVAAAPSIVAPETKTEIKVEIRLDSPKEPVKDPSVETPKGSAVADSNIRVDVGLLDKLMDLVGELVLTRNQILQFNTEREDPALNATSQRLNLITTELQEGVMKTRMQPIRTVWNSLPRVVRDMAVSLGKQIRLEMEGADTELDRTIIEAIKDPLVHLVRNSCDHGIEKPEVRTESGKTAEGKLTLRAYHEGGQVNIEIGDDGAGIDLNRVKQKAIEKGLVRADEVGRMSDREAVNLIFLPGFSTAQVVTNVSGRGVGMDVVKTRIEKIGGLVDIFNRPGEGSTVKIKIPLTLAIIPGLVITAPNKRSSPRAGSGAGECFVIPQVSLVELIRLEGTARAQIERIHGTPVYRRRGSLLPIAYLNEVLDLGQTEASGVINIIVLQAEDRQFGLVVDGINDTQEIVVKPLGKQLKGLNVYAGATIMGDGRVALILDVLGIGQKSGVLTEVREQARQTADEKVQVGEEQQRLLLFKAGSFERIAVPLSLVARLEEFPRHKVEHAAGRQVIQYRNGILPLLSLREALNAGSADNEADPLQVIVFNDGDRNLGVIVDQIIDVAETAVTVRQKVQQQGLLGSAVVGKQIADFLDLNYVIQAGTSDWHEQTNGSANGKRVLLAEPSAFSRALIRSGLDMAGYRVVEASNLEEVIRGLELEPVDVVVTALDLPLEGSAAVVNALRKRPEWRSIPVLALAESSDQKREQGEHSSHYQDCQVKFDRDAMLESIARLACVLAAEAAPLVSAGKEN